MNIKRIFTVVLLVFVVGSLGYMLVNEKKTETDVCENGVKPALKNMDSEQKNAENEDVRQGNRLIVYYFHGDKRCPTCHKLESYAKEALETYLHDKIVSEELVWKTVNVDKAENRHYINDYKLVTKSVVLSSIAGGKETRWKNLDQIWQLVKDKDSYTTYIRDSIFSFIGDAAKNLNRVQKRELPN